MTSNSNSLILATLTRAATAKDFNNCTIPVQLGFIGEKLVAIPLRCNTETASQTADGLLTLPSDIKQYPAGSVVKIKQLRPLEDKVLCTYQQTLHSINFYPKLTSPRYLIEIFSMLG